VPEETEAAKTASVYALSPWALALRLLELSGKEKHGLTKYLAERAEV